MDRRLLIIQVLLGAIGLVGVAAAAPDLTLEQAGRLAMALGLTLVMSRLRSRHIVKFSPYAFVLLLALLALVLAKGISPAGSESKRWLLIGGGFTLQPSELMKVAVIAYLATFFHNHLGNWQIWRPMLIIGVTAALIVVEPDLSTAIFVFLLALAVMLAAGATATRIISISLTAIIVAGLVASPFLGEYKYWGNRITGFLDFRSAQELSSTASYQAVTAERATERGGLIGIGAGRPVRVPEAATDFVSVSIHQALGLVGVASLLLLYGLLALHGLDISRRVTGPSALLAAGATAYLTAQAGLNLLVAAGLAPVTGMPLPGVSYGFNSLLSVAIAFGFLHIAVREGRLQEEAAEPAGARPVQRPTAATPAGAYINGRAARR